MRCEITSQVLRSLACHLIIEDVMCLEIVPPGEMKSGQIEGYIWTNYTGGNV